MITAPRARVPESIEELAGELVEDVFERLRANGYEIPKLDIKNYSSMIAHSLLRERSYGADKAMEQMLEMAERFQNAASSMGSQTAALLIKEGRRILRET